MRAWTYAVENQFGMDALGRMGIHGVTARQVGPLLEQLQRRRPQPCILDALIQGAQQGYWGAASQPCKLGKKHLKFLKPTSEPIEFKRRKTQVIALANRLKNE